MFLKRENKTDAMVAGYVVGDMKEKEYDGKKFYEVGVSMGKDAGIVNVAVWNRKPEDIKKGDYVFAAGQFNATKKDDKTYYSLTADFISKENSTKVEVPQELEPYQEVDDLPF